MSTRYYVLSNFDMLIGASYTSTCNPVGTEYMRLVGQHDMLQLVVEVGRRRNLLMLLLFFSLFFSSHL